jgi:hypothetical protein
MRVSEDIDHSLQALLTTDEGDPQLAERFAQYSESLIKHHPWLIPLSPAAERLRTRKSSNAELKQILRSLKEYNGKG